MMLLLSIILILVAGALLILLLGLCQAADAGDRMVEAARKERVQKICPLCLEEVWNEGAHWERCYGRVVREDLL